MFYSTSAEDLFHYRVPVARRLREAGYTVVLVGPAGEFAAHAEQEGFCYRRTGDALEGMSLLSDVTVGLQLARIYRNERPDIAHHFTVHGIIRGALAAGLSQVDWIVHSLPPLGDGSGRSRIAPAGLRLAVRAALRRAEVTIRTHADRQFLVRQGAVRPERAYVIASSGIEIASYVPAAEPEGTPVAALIGPLADWRAIEAFADAARRLQSGGLRARFVLVATSNTRPAVPRSTLNAWQEAGTVEWWGRRRDIPRLMATIHVACLTESYSGEIPHLMLEAAASGRPIVAPDDPAIRLLVRNGDTGYSVPRNDPETLSSALETLLDDAERRRGIGQNARRLVESEFSADLVAQQTTAVYEKLFLRGRRV